MAITQEITPLEHIPDPDVPEDFNAEADIFFGTEIPRLVEEINTWATQANALASTIEGASTFDITTYTDVAIDGVTDDTAAINAVIEQISENGGGTILMRGREPADAFYIDGTVKVLSNVELRFAGAEVIKGANGRIGIMGALEELPTVGKYEIRSASSGTTIHLSDDADSNWTHFSVGMWLMIRGENDAGGDALNRDRVQVTAIDTGANDLTVSPALGSTYQPTYPDSEWSDDDRTLITIVSSSDLVSDAARGDTTFDVADGAYFTVGDLVTIEDDKIGTDVSGTSNNQLRMETNRIIGRTDDTLTFAYPLAHDYETSFGARVQKILPATNARVVGCIMRCPEEDADTSRYPFFLQYAEGSGFDFCAVIGDPNNGLGSKSQAFRIGEGTLDCAISHWRVIRPGYYGSGEGYGVTAYAGARGWRITDGYGEGCRHTVLVFKGACDGQISRVLSVDARISDFDCHGAGECDVLFTNCFAVGGVSAALDSTEKAAFRVGNPTHRAGATNIRFSDCWAYQYPGVVLHVMAASMGVVFQGGGGVDCEGGFHLQGNSSDHTLTAADIIIRDATLTRCGGILISDGKDANLAVVNVIMDRVVSVDAPGDETLVNIDFNDRVEISGLKVLRAIDGAANYVFDCRDTTGLVVRNYEQDGGKRGFYLDACPEFMVTGAVFRDLTDRILIAESGGCDDGAFLDYCAEGFDAKFTLSASPQTTGIRFRCTETVRVSAVSAADLTALTGSGNQIPVDNTVPDSTEGTFVVDVTFKPKVPYGLLALEGKFPFVVLSATDNALATLFLGTAFVDLTCERITTGATTGSSMRVAGEVRHDLTDLANTVTCTLRVGCRSTGTTVTIGGKFAGKDVPVLTVHEIREA